MPNKVENLRKPAGQSRSPSPLLANEHFIVEACNTCYVPGYLIVTPSNAVESLPQMNPAALAELGPTLATITSAIEAVVRPQRVYCALFSEETGVIHFHLFPRTEWLTSQYFAAHPHETDISGPRLMDWARQTFQKPIRGMDRDQILEKIRAWPALTHPRHNPCESHRY